MADDWPFGDLRMFGYSVILADCPWRFENYSQAGQKKGAAEQYPCMSIDELASLPVGHLAKPDTALVLWGIFSMMPEALDLMERWGFTYKTGGAWAKQSSTGNGWAFGTGYILRAAAEFYIIGTIGNPVVRSRSKRNLIVAPVRGHSRKPEQMHADLEDLYDGPYAELFAREPRPGWDIWGNETGKFAPAVTAA